MLEKIRIETTPILLEILKDKDFGWELIEEAALKTGHPYGLVRLSFKDSLPFVLTSLADFLTFLVKHQIDFVDLTSLRTHEKIRKIIEVGFETLEPYRDALRRLINSAMVKRYFTTEMKILYDIVNYIWYKAGDQSTDYNFYTKRLLLSVAYVPTFLFWLKEGSTQESTMNVLDQKLQQVMKMGQLKQSIMNLKPIDFLKRKGVV